MDNPNQPLDTDLPDSEGKQSGLRITSSIRSHWHATSRWALFFAVLGFLYLGLLVFSLLSIASLSTGNLGGTEVTVMIFMLLLIGVLVFIPTWFMFQFSQNIQKGVSNNDLHATETGFSFLKRFYQFIGILTVIVLGFYALLLLFMFIGFAAR